MFEALKMADRKDKRDDRESQRSDRDRAPKRRDTREDEDVAGESFAHAQLRQLEHSHDVCEWMFRDNAEAAKDDGPAVPSAVRTFLQNLTRKIRSRTTYDIQGLYEEEFADISDRYFKNTTWPAASEIASLVDNGRSILSDSFFCSCWRH